MRLRSGLGVATVGHAGPATGYKSQFLESNLWPVGFFLSP
jgi:hypothetical protein